MWRSQHHEEQSTDPTEPPDDSQHQVPAIHMSHLRHPVWLNLQMTVAAVDNGLSSWKRPHVEIAQLRLVKAQNHGDHNKLIYNKLFYTTKFWGALLLVIARTEIDYPKMYVLKQPPFTISHKALG